jgi:ribosomal-protein-alanine N-acetyltransferase
MNPEVRIRPAALPADRVEMLRVLETANMHRVPSPEMDDFDVGHWFVAELRGAVVGVAGYRLLDADGEVIGKTTLLAVQPGAREHGIGRALQTLRMDRMRDAGATRVITNADRPETIAWYERHFGYRKVGEVRKLHEFGLPDVDHWTTLEAPLVPDTPTIAGG